MELQLESSTTNFDDSVVRRLVRCDPSIGTAKTVSDSNRVEYIIIMVFVLDVLLLLLWWGIKKEHGTNNHDPRDFFPRRIFFTTTTFI